MRTENDSQPKTGMKLLVVYHILSIAVVILEEQIEIGFVADPPYKVDYSVEV